jgi:hypothetical protein
MPKHKNNPPVLYQPAILPGTMADMYAALAHAKGPAERTAAAMEVINEYYNFFGGDGMRKDMWLLLSAAMGNPHAENLAKAAERYNLIFFYEFTLMLFDAVYLVHGGEKFGKMKGEE